MNDETGRQIAVILEEVCNQLYLLREEIERNRSLMTRFESLLMEPEPEYRQTIPEVIGV